jgi:hypothetical protein
MRHARSHPTYQAHPPRKIAVLPFADGGNGDYVVNKIPLAFRGEEDRARWSWTHANLRRAIAGGLGAREFVVVPLLTIDEVLATRGVTDSDKLNAIPPAELGHADTVVYEELVDYEAYYAFLVAAWEVSARVRMVSVEDGREVFSCTDGRYDVTVSPVIDPIDIVIQSVLSLLKFRDITLARAEYEVGRETVLRLPIAQRNISDLSSQQAQQGQPGTAAPPRRKKQALFERLPHSEHLQASRSPPPTASPRQEPMLRPRVQETPGLAAYRTASPNASSATSASASVLVGCTRPSRWFGGA